MSTPITTVGRVFLCEWSGPVTVTMVIALLSHLKQTAIAPNEPVVTILHLHPSSARAIVARSSTFLDVLPALWAYSQEVVIVCQGEDGLLEQLRWTLCGSDSMPIASMSKPLGFFDMLDDAFAHAQGVFPHDVLELQRQRLRSGTWPLGGECESAAR